MSLLFPLTDSTKEVYTGVQSVYECIHVVPYLHRPRRVQNIVSAAVKHFFDVARFYYLLINIYIFLSKKLLD